MVHRRTRSFRLRHLLRIRGGTYNSGFPSAQRIHRPQGPVYTSRKKTTPKLLFGQTEGKLRSMTPALERYTLHILA